MLTFVPRALFVKNLRCAEFLQKYFSDGDMWMERGHMLTRNSYNVTPEELFDLFGKFGPIRYTPRSHDAIWKEEY
jgi:RNA recognition motif-containing protein